MNGSSVISTSESSISTTLSESRTMTSSSCFRFRLLDSWNQFVGAIVVSFFTTNGRKVFSKSETVGFLGECDVVGVDCFGVNEVEAIGAGTDVEALGLPKKLDMMDRDFS